MATWGWHADPFEVHDVRSVSGAGLPTTWVRDGGVGSHDPAPADTDVAHPA